MSSTAVYHEEEAFLREITAAPTTTEVTRLVYADWLEEKGRGVDAALMRVLARPDEDELRLAYADECDRLADRMTEGQFLVLPETPRGVQVKVLRDRAAFVRVQMKLAPFQAKITEPRDNLVMGWSLPLADQEAMRPLVAEQSNLWRTKLHEPLLTVYDNGSGKTTAKYFCHRMNQTWTRGFVSAVCYPADDFLAMAGELFLIHPVRAVVLLSVPELEVVLEVVGTQLSSLSAGISGQEVTLSPRELTRIYPHGFRPNFHSAAPTQKALLEKRWPGVTFTMALEPPVSGQWEGNAAATPLQDLQRFQQMLGTFEPQRVTRRERVETIEMAIAAGMITAEQAREQLELILAADTE